MIRILHDSFFHMPPGNRVGPQLATGGHVVNVGRYSLGDCYHPNGLTSTGLKETTLRALRPDANWMVDHHYRHLVWEEPVQRAKPEAALQILPIDLGAIVDRSLAEISLQWVKLDDDLPGPAIPLRLHVHRRQDDHGIELHILGRAVSRQLAWSDICRDAMFLSSAGRLAEAHVVFEARILLDPAHTLRSARWQQGQIFYAQSPQSLHYGYEIVLNSASGVISPVAEP